MRRANLYGASGYIACQRFPLAMGGGVFGRLDSAQKWQGQHRIHGGAAK